MGAILPAVWPAGAGERELKYAVIVTRHGVRSPTWENARLNEYSAEPWPQWPVPPGNLTPHGRELIESMGGYYREWLAAERLLGAPGCQDAGRIYIRADAEQRTMETAQAFAESLAPRCGAAVHAETASGRDPLFSGFGKPDPQKMLAAVRERLGGDPGKLMGEHRAALETLQSILRTPQPNTEPVGVALKGAAPELTGPFATGSTFSEILLLEYAEGLNGPDLGWGRMTRQQMEQALEVHAVYADLMRRTLYLARSRGSNLLSHVLRSLDQAVSGKPVAGAEGNPGDALLLLSGHDTNLSNLSGMLGLSWKLPGYPADDTPPGGALIFTLWRNAAGECELRLKYVAQSPDQMRRADKLSLAAPPESQDVALPGCAAGCPWETARRLIEKAIDRDFVAKD